MDSNKIAPERKKHPRSSANILSKLTFGWTLSLFRKGFKRDLTTEDLPNALKEHKSSTLGDIFEKAWNLELYRSQRDKREPSLLSVIIRLFTCRLLLCGLVLFIIEIILRISTPILLSGLLRYFSQLEDNPEITLEMAYMYALGVIGCQALVIVISHPIAMQLFHLGMQLRVAVCSLIYRKALRINKTASSQTTSGQVINLLSNDANRFDVTFLFFHNLWIGPLQTLIITYLLWDLLGPATLIGLTVLLMFIPYNALFLGKKLSTLRLKTAVRTDERVRLMNEIINGMQVIKMYTWEKPFATLMDIARKKEVKEMRKSAQIKGSMYSFLIFHTRTAVFATILSHVLLGNTINAVKVFVLTSFYNTLRDNMTDFFPLAVTFTAESLASIKRIKEFLLLDIEKKKEMPIENGNFEINGIKSSQPISHYNQVTGKSDNLGVFIKNATAKWLDSSNENTLTNITLDVTPGRLTAVIGPVGSGKTSLFHAILRELPLTSGSIEINGSLSYSSQEPWLFQGSVRQNILFGLDYNRERYRHVVKVCSLRTDFEQFSHGDRTIVGERGVSLSGGQRARINLARAVYKDADIYLLDDPLSAVDTHVGKHLFEDCIQGYLKKKTVILITHQLQYLVGADQIMLLENGVESAKGDFTTIQQAKLDFTQLLATEEEETKIQPPPQKSDSSIQIKHHPMQAYGSIKSIQSIASSTYDESNRDLPEEVAETFTSGAMSAKVYKTYFTAAGGWKTVLAVLTMCVAAQLFATGGDYWIAYWVNLEEYVYAKDNSTGIVEPSKNITTSYFYEVPRDVCCYVYGAIIFLTIVITLSRSCMYFNMCMTASIRLHNKMFISLSRATMWFFNNNTSGRILNRFSKDMGIIDELIPTSLFDVLQIGIDLFAIIIVVASVNTLLMVPTSVIALTCYCLSRFYIATSRSIKRLEGMTKSPVFSHANATVQGLTTIRAFRAEKILIHEFDNLQDTHSSAWYIYLSISRALGYWMDLMCLIYVSVVTLSFLILGGDNFRGDVGLAITQSIGLTGNLQWAIRQVAEIENQMTSVERVREYSTLDSEHNLDSIPDKKPSKEWPENGKIEFSHVDLRYSSNDPLVLKDLNFTILPQQKVGVVGRTGAGKSSLISAIFRLTEVGGAIIIDGIDTSQMGLHDLRSKLSIIPQEPVLFSGTLRKNLDPFDEHNDDILWSALDEVELKETVSELPGGLQANISEGGSNLSLGQRQLVCLARAIVRNNKILVLDEATANVDIQTDTFIQQAIRNKFATCTVITVAHRLNTVMDSDKILVMDGGTLVEFDHPYVLLQNNDGFLYKMVERTGRSTAETLTRIAAESYALKQQENGIPTHENNLT